MPVNVFRSSKKHGLSILTNHCSLKMKYVFEVQMTCEGCANAVKRALGRLEGVKSVEVNIQDQKVEVDTAPDLTLEQVQQTIAKTGKKIVCAKTA